MMLNLYIHLEKNGIFILPSLPIHDMFLHLLMSLIYYISILHFLIYKTCFAIYLPAMSVLPLNSYVETLPM